MCSSGSTSFVSTSHLCATARATSRSSALAAAVASVAPDTVEATVGFGETTDVNVTLTNSGTGPLNWEAKERDQGVIQPPLPTPTSTIIRKKTWKPAAIPATFPRALP